VGYTITFGKHDPITLKTFKTPKTFSIQNLHIRKFCSTFAAQSRAIDFADIIKGVYWR